MYSRQNLEILPKTSSKKEGFIEPSISAIGFYFIFYRVYSISKWNWLHNPLINLRCSKSLEFINGLSRGTFVFCYQELTKSLQQRSDLRAKINSEISWGVESAVSRIKGPVTPYYYGDGTQIHSVS